MLLGEIVRRVWVDGHHEIVLQMDIAWIPKCSKFLQNQNYLEDQNTRHYEGPKKKMQRNIEKLQMIHHPEMNKMLAGPPS